MQFLLTFLMFTNAWAEPILFRAAGVSDLEYHARLRVNEAFRTPSDSYLAQHPSARSREVLLTRFERAQTAFVSNSIGEAKRHFQEVVALVHADDWSTIDREVLLHAYLRLAQLEGDASERRHWLDQTPFLGPNLKVQTDLFPPPLIAEYRALLHKGETLSIEPERTGWSLILINGIPCRARACPKFPAAEKTVRVTFVSDQWLPQTMQIDLARINKARPPRVDWVKGTCGQGQLSAPARELGDGQAFFGLACDGLAPLPVAVAPPLPTPKHELMTTSLPVAAVTPPPVDSKRAFYKSKWLWASVGVVAVGAVVFAVTRSNRHHSGATDEPAARAPEGNVPTTVYSF